MGDNVTTLINKFKEYLKPMLDWCKFNKLDINWDKTFFMFVTSKRVGKQIPNEISIENCQEQKAENVPTKWNWEGCNIQQWHPHIQCDHMVE